MQHGTTSRPWALGIERFVGAIPGRHDPDPCTARQTAVEDVLRFRIRCFTAHLARQWCRIVGTSVLAAQFARGAPKLYLELYLRSQTTRDKLMQAPCVECPFNRRDVEDCIFDLGRRLAETHRQVIELDAELRDVKCRLAELDQTVTACSRGESDAGSVFAVGVASG